MTAHRHSVRPFVAAALLCAAGASHADIAISTSLASFQAAVGGSGASDNFGDLTINTDLGVSTLNRAAGGMPYTVSTQTDFFVVPVGGAVALSTGVFSDSITFAGFGGGVRSLGANYYGTNVLGEVTGGALTVVATDIFGVTRTQSVAGGSANGFLGFLSDAPLASVVVSITAPNTNLWASVDNVVLSAVPETATWLSMLMGGAAVLRLAARRRA